MLTDGYSVPIRMCIDRKVDRQIGDRVEIYGNGHPVIERNGRIYAILGQNGWERPEMICEIPKKED